MGPLAVQASRDKLVKARGYVGTELCPSAPCSCKNGPSYLACWTTGGRCPGRLLRPPGNSNAKYGLLLQGLARDMGFPEVPCIHVAWSQHLSSSGISGSLVDVPGAARPRIFQRCGPRTTYNISIYLSRSLVISAVHGAGEAWQAGSVLDRTLPGQTPPAPEVVSPAVPIGHDPWDEGENTVYCDCPCRRRCATVGGWLSTHEEGGAGVPGWACGGGSFHIPRPTRHLRCRLHHRIRSTLNPLPTEYYSPQPNSKIVIPCNSKGRRLLHEARCRISAPLLCRPSPVARSQSGGCRERTSGASATTTKHSASKIS